MQFLSLVYKMRTKCLLQFTKSAFKKHLTQNVRCFSAGLFCFPKAIDEVVNPRRIALNNVVGAPLQLPIRDQAMLIRHELPNDLVVCQLLR